jgi:hypothetical protein
MVSLLWKSWAQRGRLEDFKEAQALVLKPLPKPQSRPVWVLREKNLYLEGWWSGTSGELRSAGRSVRTGRH